MAESIPEALVTMSTSLTLHVDNDETEAEESGSVTPDITIGDTSNNYNPGMSIVFREGRDGNETLARDEHIDNDEITRVAREATALVDYDEDDGSSFMSQWIDIGVNFLPGWNTELE